MASVPVMLFVIMTCVAVVLFGRLVRGVLWCVQA
jgi:hypothetical protein